MVVLNTSCNVGAQKSDADNNNTIDGNRYIPFNSASKTIHVFVALCDNKYQGIVPAPAKIGNGQDAETNLYWGGLWGVRTFFNKSREWQLLKSYNIDTLILQRLIYKHKTANFYLVADAYNGKYIKRCTADFLNSCAGKSKDTLTVNNTIGINGNAKLLAYIGHDGLMDFKLNDEYMNVDRQQRDAIILACISQQYFAPYMRSSNTRPLVWTTGLMCPEAYTLHDALSAYVKGDNATIVRKQAAMAYAKYQHCGDKAALDLLVSGVN
ncbi:hypothetical protein GCM10023149_12940 [Mucilaginibacter gynuensis]|uniref:Uncharacterized protein n=1 Tax=Mucilaginibacter gynuensis TaxID=1302236 RepID=A0ABP8G2M8_9SPHI